MASAVAGADQRAKIHLHIGGVPRESGSGGTHEHLDPYTQQVQTIVPLAGEAEVNEAVERALAVKESWRRTSPEERRDILNRLGLTDLSAIQPRLSAALVQGSKTIAAQALSVGKGTANFIISLFIMLYLLFFFLRDGTRMFDRLQRLIPVPEDHREQLFDHLSSVTRGVFYGIGLTAIFQGILVGIGFWISGMPSPVVFGVLAGILALLPAGGAAIVWIPAVLYLAAAGHWGMFIFLLIWGFIISTSDNFLRPILVSRYAPVSAFTVFVGVVGGIGAFGAIGIVVGPVFLALVAAIIEYFDEKVIAPNKRRLDAQADNERPPPMPGL